MTLADTLPPGGLISRISAGDTGALPGTFNLVDVHSRVVVPTNNNLVQPLYFSGLTK